MAAEWRPLCSLVAHVTRLKGTKANGGIFACIHWIICCDMEMKSGTTVWAYCLNW